MHCYRCNKEITQDAQGYPVFHCNCYDFSRPVDYAFTNEHEENQPCPLCGVPIFSKKWHRCKAIGVVPTPQLKPEPIILEAKPGEPPQQDDLRLEHVDRMRAYLAEHERDCERCSYFYYRSEKTRCAQYLNMATTLGKWEKRLET